MTIQLIAGNEDASDPFSERELSALLPVSAISQPNFYFVLSEGGYGNEVGEFICSDAFLPSFLPSFLHVASGKAGMKMNGRIWQRCAGAPTECYQTHRT